MKFSTALAAAAIFNVGHGESIRGKVQQSLESKMDMSNLQSDSYTQNNAESYSEDMRDLILAGIGELPGGNLAGLLVEKAWPSEEVDLWEVVKDKFTYLLTQTVSTTIITAIKGNAGSVAEKVGYFEAQAEQVIANPTTYTIHAKLQNALNELVTLRNSIEEYNAATDSTSTTAVAQLIPLAVGSAVSEMTLRRFQYDVCHYSAFTQTANGKTTNMYNFDSDYCNSASTMKNDMVGVWSEWYEIIRTMYPKWYSWRLSKFSTSSKCWINEWSLFKGSYKTETSCEAGVLGEYTHFDKTGEVTDSLLSSTYDISFDGNGALGGVHMTIADFENCLLAIRERFMTQYAFEMQTIMGPTWILRRLIPGYRNTSPALPNEFKYVVVGPISGTTARTASASAMKVTSGTRRFPTSIAKVSSSYTGTYGPISTARVYYDSSNGVMAYKFKYSTANKWTVGVGDGTGKASYYDAVCSSGSHLSGVRLAFSTSTSQGKPTGVQWVCTNESTGGYSNKPSTGLSGYTVRASGGVHYTLQAAMFDNESEDYTQSFIYEYNDPEGITAQSNIDGITSWASTQSTSYVSSDMRKYMITAGRSF